MGSPDKAGLEIYADLAAFRKELTQARTDLANFNIQALKSATGVKQVEDAANNAKQGFDLAKMATQAWATALGYLGVNSISQIVSRVIGLGKEVFGLAVNLEAMENRSKAIFGSAFPKMQKAAEDMARSMKRSSDDILEFMTGFGTILDSVGLAPQQIQKMSTDLTKLTITLGKAFPDRSDVEIYDAIASAIEGNVRGLRSLGIVVNDKQLQDFAEHEHSIVKVKDMDQEQKSYLIAQYILKETTKLQEAGAVATGNLGDSAKTTAAAWKDLEEEWGKDASGTATLGLIAIKNELISLNAVINATIWAFNVLREVASIPMAATSWIKGGGFMDFYTSKAQQEALKQGIDLSNQNTSLQAANSLRFKDTGRFSEKTNDINPLKRPSTLGDGGSKARADAEQKIAEQEKKILDAIGEEASKNKENLEAVKDILEKKLKLGTITEAEKVKLDAINHRLTEQKGHVDDLIRTWEDAEKRVKQYEKDIDDLNKKILEDREKLDQDLADIDAETERKKAQATADLLVENQNIDAKIARGEGATPEEQAKYAKNKELLDKAKYGTADADTIAAYKNELQQLNAYAGVKGNTLDASQQLRKTFLEDQIKNSKGATGAGTFYKQGEDLAKIANDPYAKIDEEQKQKKLDDVKQYNKELEQSTGELAVAQGNLNTAIQGERAARDAVSKAITDQQAIQATAFPVIEKATQAHVAAEIAQYEALRVKLGEVSAAYAAAGVGSLTSQPAQKKARGGPVVGPGGPTDDRVPILGSNGEHMLTAADVQAMGGHSGVFSFRRMLHNPYGLPRFAHGGPISSSDSHDKTITVHQTNYGEAARRASDRRMIRWELRKLV
jgi:hypothetical protein